MYRPVVVRCRIRIRIQRAPRRGHSTPDSDLTRDLSPVSKPLSRACPQRAGKMRRLTRSPLGSASRYRSSPRRDRRSSRRARRACASRASASLLGRRASCEHGCGKIVQLRRRAVPPRTSTASQRDQVQSPNALLGWDDPALPDCKLSSSRRPSMACRSSSTRLGSADTGTRHEADVCALSGDPRVHLRNP